MQTLMPFSPRTLLAVAASFCLALILTPLVRGFARRFGFIAKPKIDRWHKKPTAMLGGIAIWLTVIIISLAFSLKITYGREILLASTFLFLVGLVIAIVAIGLLPFLVVLNWSDLYGMSEMDPTSFPVPFLQKLFK